MAWLGLLLGVILGAAFWGFPGAFALGFLGWLTGFVVKSQGQAQASSAVDPTAARFGALDRRIAALEARLARVERASAIETDLVATRREEVVAPPPIPQPVEVPAPRAPDPEPAAVKQPRNYDAAVPAAAPKPNFIVAWFTGGNTIVRVGLVILFVGLAFLIKYGVEHQLVPVELRVAGVAAAGMALLAVGWWLRAQRAGYALSLQGAGVAVLYLTVFGALRLYHLLPPGFAFALLVAIAALSAFLAVAQDSLVLAVFGVAGGFLAPVLASTGHGDHVMLFSYYIVLNAAIVGMAWFRAWRVLNVLGFAFTFLVGLAWGTRSYTDELFASTEPFVAIFFVMYVGIALLFARKQVEALRDPVDATIVFGVPIAAFGLQAGMLRGSEFGLAWSSVAAGALYLTLATALRKLPQERWGLLAKAFLALGMVFTSLAIPLALDARWTSAAWAAEGAGVVWIATRQGSRLARAFGILLQLLAAAAFVRAYPALPPGPSLVNAAFIGMLLVALAGFLTHRMLAPGAKPGSPEHVLVPVFFLWGLAWWLAAGFHEIETGVEVAYRPAAMLLFVTATTAGFAMLARIRGWDAFRWPEWAFAPVLALFTLLFWAARSHPAADLGWLAWPLALAAHFVLLRRDESHMPGDWSGVQHVVGALVIAALGAMELQWAAAVYAAPHTAWSASARMVMPAIVVLAIAWRAADSRWPVAAHETAYRLSAAPLLLAAIAVWSLFVNFTHDGASDPLPYLPLVNALDLGHVLAIFAGLSWWLALRRRALAPPEALRGRNGMAILAVLVFAWLNAILLRSIHHWTGVPYLFSPMFASITVQAALSIFWSVLALSLMLWATRGGRRAAWMVGAGLMAVVVVKLVLLDLSHLSGLTRILAFIVVGVLMLVIGYFSPVPPKMKEQAA